MLLMKYIHKKIIGNFEITDYANILNHKDKLPDRFFMGVTAIIYNKIMQLPSVPVSYMSIYRKFYHRNLCVVWKIGHLYPFQMEFQINTTKAMVMVVSVTKKICNYET